MAWSTVILLWVISTIGTDGVIAEPNCTAEDFFHFIEKDDNKNIRLCLSDNATYNSLCREEFPLESGTPLTWPAKEMLKWRQLCEHRQQYRVSGTVTFGDSGGNNSDGRVMQLKGLTAGSLPPGRYLAEISVSEQTPEQRSAALKAAPAGKPGTSGNLMRVFELPRRDPATAKSQDIKAPDVNEFTAGLAKACPVSNLNMDKCFLQGFKNARTRFQKMNPLTFDANLKGGSRALKWEVVGDVRVFGISNYTVKSVRAQSSNDPKRNRPLAITTEWVTKGWRIELGITHHLAFLSEAFVFKLNAKVALELPDVSMLNSMDIWGEQQPNGGVVRFYTEDKQFRIKFKVGDAKIRVTIHKIPWLNEFDAFNELVRLHFKFVALNEIWPTIHKKLGQVFKQVINGEVVPGVINFLLTRGTTPGRGEAPPRRP